ncbi:MAG: 3-deoxy-7-phosphoheptulonate synthase [Candidatus Dormibacteria bacterium]
MLVLMRQDATQEQVDAVMRKITDRGFRPVPIPGTDRTAIGILGSNPLSVRDLVLSLPGVADAHPVSKPFKLVSREFHPEPTQVVFRDCPGQPVIGAADFFVIAGPCAVESPEQTMETARLVKAAGAHALRGGAFKPRSSPYSFRGLGEEGLRALAAARTETGLPVVTEVLNAQDVDLVARYADLLQIGARNMQNYGLLEEAGRTMKPVLLKRGMSATIEEWLLSAEYIANQGNEQIVLCERGIRTFETYTRNTLDLAAVLCVRELSHLPVIVDPSHGTGRWNMIAPMARAALAVGADGLMVEVHPNPAEAASDGAQSLNPERFATMMDGLRRLEATAAGV